MIARGEPDVVHGAWVRRCASVEGGAPFETQTVVWLQAGPCYADIRVPFHPAADQRCFTGRSGWDGERFRWTHALDLETVAGEVSPAADDVGDLTWEDGALVERGMFPTPSGAVVYEEVWDRLPAGDGPWMVYEGSRGCLVRVGDHALTVVDERAVGGAFGAAYRRLGARSWIDVAVIGDPLGVPQPDEPPSAWRLVHQGNAQVVLA